MNILIVIVVAFTVLILAAGLLWTIALAGKGDENYSSATKGNVTRLSLIYILLAVVLIIGLAVYSIF